ncbi:amidohydrolase [Lysobacter sp. LF1]|uniref:Amidohydrolase n=1 Tax=Lysobacter stagni TaxID=3045172 RepID=A0ABT6XM44_9GAMM|nr:amidohydrolase [Lysobacter sp. LF1]MDI9240815.1 amidohydrolase [Lysobacter sp. LF1]
MRKLVWAVSAALAVMSGTALGAKVTVLTAAKIHTLETAHPTAQAMAFDDTGRILALGDAATLGKRYPKATRLDVGNATVIPGLIDAHAHVSGLGMTMLSADLVGADDKQDVLQRLQAFAKQLPAGAWLIGRGWDQNDWPEKRFPTAADLDAAFPDRPVWLERIDGHAGWANTAAMRAVKRDLSGDWQPDGGRIERAGGKATGIFVDGAMSLVDQARPPLDEATAERALSLGMQSAVEHGLTGVHDAGVSLAELKRYQRLADRGAMPLRITAMADGNNEALESLCANGLYAHPSGRLKMRTLKLYADGALGSRGAAMLQEYSDDHGNLGLMVTSPEQIAVAVEKAKRCGVQVATHAIGDRGNHVVLEAYAKALGNDATTTDHRWRIEHAQVLSKQDLPRLAQLHVIASMQPTHATSDMPWAQDRVGAERIIGAYAWRQLRDSGARLALGSDFPVESVDPRFGLYAAATRADAQGLPAGGWFPQEKLTAFEALRGFTLDAAYAGFAENEVGSLEVGKRADFVVLTEDPLAIAPSGLRNLSVQATYVDGEAVYRAK